MRSTFVLVGVLVFSLLVSGCVSRSASANTAEQTTEESVQADTGSILREASPDFVTAAPPEEEARSATPEQSETPTETPTLTPAPTPDIVITKHPNDDPGIIEGNTQISVARAENAELIHWQIASPDESRIYTDGELEAAFPVNVYKVDAETLWIVSIPVEMDGYKVRAVFAKDGNEAYSKWATIHVIGFFTQIPHDYTFSSGAGAWSTEIHLENDGSFTGYFHDWDAYGPNGEQGYLAECQFYGHFGRVGKIDQHIYTMEVLDLTQDGHIGDRYMDDDGMTHEIMTPYGFDKASLFYVYTPGIQKDKLQQGFVDWAHLYDDTDETYESYGLYNYYGKQGFVQTS